MYQLYYYPNNASLAPHFILEELAAPFELVLVDRKSRAQKSAEYMALNPSGRIPTLIDGDMVLFESAAICLHIAEKNAGISLVPAIGHRDRSVFFQWLMYLTNTVQAELMVYFYPDKHTVGSTAVDAANIVTAQERRVTDMFRLLDQELDDREYLVGDTLSVCDYYLLMLSIWADEFSQPPLSFENLGRHLRNMVKREAVQRVCAKEDIPLELYQ